MRDAGLQAAGPADSTTVQRVGRLSTSIGVSLLVGCLAACGETRTDVLVPDGSPTFALMSFAETLSRCSTPFRTAAGARAA